MGSGSMSRRSFIKAGTVAAATAAAAGVLTGSASAAVSSAVSASSSSSSASSVSDYAEDADVVIVGTGGAGMTAAIMATTAGAKVIALEKESVVGGNTKIASSTFTAAGAQVQADAAIDGATSIALYDKLYNDTTDRDAIWLLADNSGDAADFLTSIGMDLTRCWATFSCGPADGSAPGPLESAALENAMIALGIDYRLDSLATSIVRADDGSVEGIEVEGPDGTYSIKTSAVIVASGGYAANSEMVAQYDPRWEGLSYSCGPQATGEGTTLAIDAGAAVSGMDNTKVNPTAYYIDETTAISMAPIRLNGGIIVATNDSEKNSGKRIVNEEGAYTPNSVTIMDNGGSAYMVFDQTLIDQVAAISGFNDAGYLISADTLDELADQMEVDKDAFLETCANWTKYAQSGKDPDFGKTNFTTDLTVAPFYTVRVKPAVQGTFGGITIIPTSTQVLDGDGKIIPGLFACGECADDGTMGAAPTSVNVVFGTVACASVMKHLEEQGS